MSTPPQLAATLSAVSRAAPPAGQVVLCRLGQAGVLLRGGGLTVVVDPFLSDDPRRLVPAGPPPETFDAVDVVLCTHGHRDHLDRDALVGIAAASPRAAVVVPEPLVGTVTGWGVAGERVVGARPGVAVQLSSLTVTPVAAMHGEHVADGYRVADEEGRHPWLGYVLDLGGTRVYHGGDTLWWRGLESALGDIGVDLALLPINGRDALREARDIVGNLDAREAAHLAVAAGADTVVPLHYDVYPGNRGHPDRLVETVVDEQLPLSVLVLPVGAPHVYAPPTR